MRKILNIQNLGIVVLLSMSRDFQGISIGSEPGVTIDDILKYFRESNFSITPHVSETSIPEIIFFNKFEVRGARYGYFMVSKEMRELSGSVCEIDILQNISIPNYAQFNKVPSSPQKSQRQIRHSSYQRP